MAAPSRMVRIRFLYCFFACRSFNSDESGKNVSGIDRGNQVADKIYAPGPRESVCSSYLHQQPNPSIFHAESLAEHVQCRGDSCGQPLDSFFSSSLATV